ncbi:zona pellucida sperm-binding protein 4-like [Scomber japonicus]|uniref:zona pellucida sperm-binding protein 4-like n=1 Tax=Scomber japonicus TaxID=13676 RepID=UPI0023059E55|nr:zona pellucida sperm-binding protein 4-like [Scomber japonicus]
MELFKCLFGVVVTVLVCGVTAQHHWRLPQQQTLHLVPTKPPQRQVKLPAPAAPFDECHVEEREKIECGPRDVTPEQCENINCCFDGRQCYYGKKVTVQCTRDGQFVVVVSRDATLPQIDVDSVSLLETNDASCSPIDMTSTFAIFQFPVTNCGTTIKEEEGYIVYENHMSSSYEVGVGPRGSITRDSHFELLFQCRYSGTAVEALVMEVNAVPPPVPVAAAGPLRMELRLGNGQCHTKGCVEEEAAYRSFYSPEDYPIIKELRAPVYIEVHILDRSDPSLILHLEHCWATSTPNAHSVPQWDLLVDGCPYRDDRYLTTVVPVDGSSGLQHPTHHKRFIVKMFTFVDHKSYTPQKDMVFIHCAAAVCYPSSTNSCEQPCHRQRRAVTAARIVSSQRALVSSGEVILTKQKTSSAIQQKNKSSVTVPNIKLKR